MAQNEQKPAHVEPQLCQECMEMFGHPSFDNMCSSCFKKRKNQNKFETKLEAKSSVSPDKEKVEVLPEKVSPCKKRTAEEREDKPEVVRGRCAKCSKKTGMLGYACKHCGSEFCKFHRLPEEHECEADFISLGRKQIKTDNPLISKKKIEHI